MILLVSSTKNWLISEVREHRWIQSLFVESALWPRWSRPLHLKPFTLWIVLTPESVMILLVSSKLTDLGSQGTSLDSIVVCRERPLASFKPTLTKAFHSLNSFATYSRMGNLSSGFVSKGTKTKLNNSIGSNVAISASCFWTKKTKEQLCKQQRWPEYLIKEIVVCNSWVPLRAFETNELSLLKLGWCKER